MCVCRTGEPLEDNTSDLLLPEGADIQVWLHLLHTHPDFWGNDSLEFDPDRWLPDAPNGPKRADVFFPFLEGQRRCSGIHLAELQFLILMYTALVLLDVKVCLPDPSTRSKRVDWLHDTEEREENERLTYSDGPRHSAIIPGGPGEYKLRMRADMFSAYDGRMPFTMRAT
jgi:hypothetical protein